MKQINEMFLAVLLGVLTSSHKQDIFLLQSFPNCKHVSDT